MREDFRAYDRYSRMKKQANKQFSTNLLIEQGIIFESKNDGLHLVIRTRKGNINFFPSTGLYNGAVKGRGVYNLLKEVCNDTK